MAYVFEREESIAGNINRVLAQEVEASINSLESPDGSPEEMIHGVRKRIKKIRALLRLVRSELHRNVFGRANAHYRAIGHQLAHLRDATVMMNTLEKLRQAHPDSLPTSVLSSIKKTLARRQAQASREFFDAGNQIEEVADAFRQAARTVPALAKDRNSFSVFAPNLKAIYRRGRKALRIAVREPSSHNFHELRKDVKTLWYHTRLLQPMWPGLFGAYEKEMGRLGELLGEDHDFGVLAEEIESGRLLLRNGQTKEAVLRLLQQQRAGLQEQILPLASRLFAEKTGDFVGRYRLYWKLWRAEAQPESSTEQVQAA